MIIFVDLVAEGLQLANSTVVTLEADQGIMDVIGWIETRRIDISKFDIISLMIGRGDINRSQRWFITAIDEFMLTVNRTNNRALFLLGAAIPGIRDAKWMVAEFLARNSLLQRRCVEGRDRYRVEYTRPGKVRLGKGGPVAKFYGPEAKLNTDGLIKFRDAVMDKFFSADLAVWALRLRKRNPARQCRK